MVENVSENREEIDESEEGSDELHGVRECLELDGNGEGEESSVKKIIESYNVDS